MRSDCECALGSIVSAVARTDKIDFIELVVPSQEFVAFPGGRPKVNAAQVIVVVRVSRNVIRIVYTTLQVVYDMDGVAIIQGKGGYGTK